MAGHFQHAALKDTKQANGASADNCDVGGVGLGQSKVLNRMALLYLLVIFTTQYRVLLKNDGLVAVYQYTIFQVIA